MLMAQGYVVGVVLGLRRSVRGIFLSVRDGGCAARYNGEVRRAAEEGEKKKGLKKNLSEGRGKCINDLVAAGLTGLHGHGWRMVTVLPHAPKSCGYVTLSCGGVCWCAEVLRYASPKASGVRRYSRLKT